ncbi:MAG: rhodanese-like domain-containing protein, partial [Gammaproteobacteria bacterium]|nr:rhodanese-like domain-containing protein [Gammaproteobacteria bacterium]
LSSANVRIIDMSDDTQYQRFHIPGAIHLPYQVINVRDKKGVSLSAGKDHIIKILGLLGTTPEHHVVIYDDMGGLNASRLFWELEQLGHKNISLLDGGLVKWILSGNKVVAEVPDIKAVQYKANKTTLQNKSVTAETILQSKYTAKNILLDVRSKEEYIGNPAYPRSGHIPGAKWWEWQQSVNFENGFTMRNPAELKSELTSLGIKQIDIPITVYCQSGHRASQSYFTLRNLGFKNVKIYDGSMADYSKIKSAPLNKGLTP